MEFCRDVERRVQAASVLAENLPRTAPDIELLLTRTPHRLSPEVQYTVLHMLDSLPISHTQVRRLLPTVLHLLANVNSRTARLWMKIGCLLGDGFLKYADASARERILAELVNAVRTANSVHARKGALHGIEHALNHASLGEGKRLLDVLRERALEDSTLSFRRSAFALLRDGWWWGDSGLPKLHAYARKLGATLQYPD